MSANHIVVGICILVLTGVVQAQEHEVGQKNKAFTVEQLTVSVGDTVRFPNHDDIHHNVFSLSEAATFDLGSYAKGESREVVLEEPGTVEVECAIHPQMRMVIEVK